MVLYARHFFENGNEVKVELYDDDGILCTRSEHIYNESGKEIKAMEFIGTDAIPFKVKNTIYNERGQVLSVGIAYDDEEEITEAYKYDSIGRLVHASFLDEEGEGQQQEWKYESDLPEPITCIDYKGITCLREITYVYRIVSGKQDLVEEVVDVKANRWDSRIHKYYSPGEMPFGVVEEVYNADGEFLEEIRHEFDHRGLLISNSTHLSDAEDCAPYEVRRFAYDNRGNCVEERYGNNKYANDMWLMKEYDSQNRIVKSYSEGVPGVMLIYKRES